MAQAPHWLLRTLLISRPQLRPRDYQLGRHTRTQARVPLHLARGTIFKRYIQHDSQSKSDKQQESTSNNGQRKWRKSFNIGGPEDISETPQPPYLNISSNFYFIRRHRKAFYIFILVCAAIFIYVIVNGTIQEVPVTGRKRFALLTPEQEHMMGEMMAKQMIDKVEGDILPLNHPVSIAVKMIGDRICEANGLDKMTYFVIESDTANAFVVGGKYVFVYLGIVPVFKDADGAALVIAHEISHVLAGHASDGALRVAFTVACSVFLGVFGDMLLSAIGRTFLKLAFVLPRSRAAEYEADQIGIHLVEKACFDSKNAIDVFVRLRQHVDKTKEENGETLYTRGVVTDLIATHPDTLARITALHLARETEQFKAIEKDAKLCRTRITADFSKAEVPNKEKKDKRTQQNAP